MFFIVNSSATTPNEKTLLQVATDTMNQANDEGWGFLDLEAELNAKLDLSCDIYFDGDEREIYVEFIGHELIIIGEAE